MKKIKTKLKRTSQPGLIHDSRKDVVSLMNVVNELIDKTNELIDAIENLALENENLKDKILHIETHK